MALAEKEAEAAARKLEEETVKLEQQKLAFAAADHQRQVERWQDETDAALQVRKRERERERPRVQALNRKP